MPSKKEEKKIDAGKKTTPVLGKTEEKFDSKSPEINKIKEENPEKTFDWESAEGQEVLHSQRKVRPQEEATESVPSDKETSPREISLEEAVAEERVRQRQPESGRIFVENKYVLQLSEQPIRSLQEEMGQIYRIVEDRGYITSDEARRVEYLSSAVEKKLEAIDEGKYSLTEEVARAALLTQSISDSLRNTYRHNKKEDDRWYRSG